MFDANGAPTLCLDLHYIQTDHIELPLEPHELGIPTHASKTISEPLVCLV
jgi:hypothetical protein